MAPQAAPHRRGGKHRVKDNDLTHSIYDEFSYADVLDLAKERGIYRKDMKKKEMAMANKQYDADIQRRERLAIIDRQKRELEQKKVREERNKEKQAAILVKQKRIVEKDIQRTQGAQVSDDSLDEDEMDAEYERLTEMDDYKQDHVGDMISDESWDSTSMESTAPSANQGMLPDCRLRLYEWPEWPCEPHIPSVDREILSNSGSSFEVKSEDWEPIRMPYAPLKVITTNSKQKMFLPGQTYPPGVQPDFVPILPQHTRIAARNGVLVGILRKATIERASDWAERTHIRGDSATMFFNPPNRSETKNLADTYDKWSLEERKLLRVRGRGEGVRADRVKRHAQRFRNKAKKVVEVYEACQYRPLAVCYMPSYLDYSTPQTTREVQNELEDHGLANLFYVRFPGCDVPHYYFWVRRGDWRDPTRRNPDWEAAKVQQNWSTVNNSDASDQIGQCVTVGQSCKKAWARVKIPDIRHVQPVVSEPWLDTVLSSIERQLYTSGLAATLSTYREKWISNGKQHAWNKFSRALPSLYPSGKLPLVPPPTTRLPQGHSLALKLATLDTLGSNDATRLSPLHGDEAWTRDDDAFWHLVEVEETPSLTHTEGMQSQLQHSSGIDGDSIITWLDQVCPSSGPWPVSNVSFQSGFEEWDSVSGDGHRKAQSLATVHERCSGPCSFGGLEWTGRRARERTGHVGSHNKMVSARRPRSRGKDPREAFPARRRSEVMYLPCCSTVRATKRRKTST